MTIPDNDPKPGELRKTPHAMPLVTTSASSRFLPAPIPVIILGGFAVPIATSTGFDLDTS
jgi:hypothetical protein